MLKNFILNYLNKVDLKYAIYIKDLCSNEVISINEKEIVPSASIIKIFIMGAVLDAINNKALSLNQRVTVSKEEKVPYSIVYLLDDENTYTIKDLITLMIIQSDNTATNKLIDIIGEDKINQFIRKINCSNTSFQRKMMDFEAQKNGKENLTNVYDVAKILELIYDKNLINKECSKLMEKILIEQLDNSMMRIDLADNLTIAHKTGDLDKLKHDAGIVYTKDKDYIFIMFTWKAASDNYARNVIGDVSKITYEYFIEGGR